MNVLGHLRIERAVQSYDFWLDLRGAAGSRRRELRRELRANLREAAGRRGATAAVRALGGARQMAAEAVPENRTMPRWTAGLQAGAAALLAVLLVELLAALAWLDGAMAATEDGRVQGALTLFPGSSLTYEPQGQGFSLLMAPGWACLVVGVLALLLVARPWRLLTARPRRRPGPTLRGPAVGRLSQR